VERRFDIRPLRNGIGLRPRDPGADVKMIEVTGATVAIDGSPVTGAELRSRLGSDASLILQLTYLSDADRRAFIEPKAPAPATPPVETRPSTRDQRGSWSERRARRDGYRVGDRVHIMRSLTVGPDEVVDGNAVAIMGSARVDGEVRGDAVAILGSMTLGPSAEVGGNVVVVGGVLHRDPGARVRGEVQEVSLGSVDFGDGRWMRNPWMLWWGSMVGSAVALVGTLARLAILCLLTALVILLGRGYVDMVETRAAAEPVKAGAIGLLSQILFVPLLVISIVVLVITIIGIPLLLLLPFVLLGLIVVALVGSTSVGHYLGRLVAARMGWSVDNPYLTTITGIVLVMSPVLLARIAGLGGGIMFPMTAGLSLIGVLVEYLAWTVGFGAVALARFTRPSTVVPAAS